MTSCTIYMLTVVHAHTHTHTHTCIPHGVLYIYIYIYIYICIWLILLYMYNYIYTTYTHNYTENTTHRILWGKYCYRGIACVPVVCIAGTSIYPALYHSIGESTTDWLPPLETGVLMTAYTLYHVPSVIYIYIYIYIHVLIRSIF